MEAKKRALILVNKLAREGESDIEPAVEVLKRRGVECEQARFDDPAKIAELIRRRGPDTDRIVVGGGDGTLNASLESVLESGLPLGILPMGTANDLARTLGIPFSVVKAAEIIAAGRIYRVDLGLANNKHFFNVASIGLAAEVTHVLTGEMKKKWGALSYIVALFDAFRSHRPFSVQIVCDGKSHRHKSIQIAIGNGRYYGGGMTIRKSASIDDQTLDLYSIEPRGFWELLRAGPSIITGNFENKPRIWLMQGRRIHVATRKSMGVDTDGELTTTTPTVFSVKKRVLPVFVPEDWFPENGKGDSATKSQ